MIQTFPQDWIFAGNRAAQYRLVGNAVPPALAECLGGMLAEMLEGEPEEGPFDFPLPPDLAAAIRYTKKEEARNGASRRAIAKV